MKKIVIISTLIVAIFATSCSSSNDSESQSESTTSSSIPREAIIKDNKTSCGDPALDPNKSYTVVFETNKGTFSVKLDVENAPVSTAHLAALVNSGFYDGLTFHRVVPDFVIQGGDPNGDGTGSSDCTVISEEPPREYKQGDFAWAKAGDQPAGTAGSQFFIITGADNSQGVQFLSQKNQSPGDLVPKIQYGYAGVVISGLDIAKSIEALAADGSDGPPSETVTILKAKLVS